jgi:hypothetical protein
MSANHKWKFLPVVFVALAAIILVLHSAAGLGMISQTITGTRIVSDSNGSRASSVLTAPAGTQSAEAGAKVFPAYAFQDATTADNALSIAIPNGWTLTSADGDALISIQPSDGSQLKAYILLFPVSDLRYRYAMHGCEQLNPIDSSYVQCVVQAVGEQYYDSSYAWTPSEALTLILQIASSNGASFGRDQTEQGPNGTAQFSVPVSVNGGTVELWGNIAMDYITNVLFTQASGQPGVTSLALVTGCQAPQDQASNFESECGSIIRSFSPSQNLFNNIASSIMQDYQKEVNILIQMAQSEIQNIGIQSQMIQEFGQNMVHMQTQMYQDFQQQNYYDGEQWVATLGEQTNMQDPNNGNVYPVPSGYGSYCVDSSGNDVLAGNDLQPGETIGNYECQTMLNPWQ